jgi:hypothetical protein
MDVKVIATDDQFFAVFERYDAGFWHFASFRFAANLLRSSAVTVLWHSEQSVRRLSSPQHPPPSITGKI